MRASNRKHNITSRRILAAALGALLAAVLAAGALAPASAADGSLSLNYSKGESVFNRSIQAVEVVRLICGEECGEAERACLETDPDLNFTYTPILDSKSVTVSGIGDKITVKASAVTYTAQNGAAVVWSPVSAHLQDGSADGMEAALTEDDGLWEHTFTGYTETLIYTVTVVYGAGFEIGAEDADAVINYAYRAAAAATGRQSDYDSAAAEYAAAKKAYEDYLAAVSEYNAAYQVYSAYAARREVYLGKKQAYQDYLAAVERYGTDSALYAAYLTAAAEYAEALERYNEEVAGLAPAFEAYNAYLAEYDTYLAGVSACLASMTALENCYAASSGGHVLYSTIMGSTVDSVLAKRDELVSAGGSALGQYVDAAGSSTDALRALLTEYKGIRKGDSRQRFDWYVLHYAELKSNFRTLYDSLKTLYSSSVVRLGMSGEGGDGKDRTIRYCEFVAHLYIISTWLDDSAKTDTANWYMNSKQIRLAYEAMGITHTADYTLADFFSTDPENALTDTNSADPSSLTWPEEPEPVDKPTVTTVVPPEPERVDEPLEPTPVEDPGEPEPEVPEPEKPASVPAPGNQPQPPVFTAVERQLLEALSAGTLKLRTGPSGPVVIDETCEISKILSSDDVGEFPVVTFRDYDGSLLGHVQVKDGRLGEADIPSPTIPPDDERNTYTFNGWMGTDGRLFDFSDIRADATLYPDVTEKPVVYTVTWSTASGKTKQSYNYGDIPTFTGKTTKKADARYFYTFAGWDTDPQPVTASVTYTARYSKEERYYSVRWVLRTRTVEETYKYGDQPVCPFDPYSEAVQSSDTQYFGFAGWDTAPAAVAGDTVYTAVYSSSWILPSTAGDGSVEGLAVVSEASAYRASVSSDQADLDLSYLASRASELGKSVAVGLQGGVSVTLPEQVLSKLPASGGIRLRLSSAAADGDGNELSVSLSNSSGQPLGTEGIKVSFDLPAGAEYRCTETGDGGSRTLTLFSEAGARTAVLGGSAEKIAVVRLYSVSFAMSANGAIRPGAASAAAGETVSFELSPSAGYTAEGGKGVLTGPDGASEELPAGALAFVMPAHDVELSYEFLPEEYTVRFYVDGTLYSSGTYRYGDRLNEPDVPSKPDTDTVGYVFRGWSPSLCYTVTGDQDYNATFAESPLSKVEDDPLIIPEWVFVLAAVAVIAATFFVARAIVRRQKRQSET